MNAKSIDLSTLTNGKLIKHLEKCDANRAKATNAVFDLGESNNVKFRDILSRFGEDHPVVAAYEEAENAMSKATAEARYRVGPVPFDTPSIYIAYLQNQKTSRKAA